VNQNTKCIVILGCKNNSVLVMNLAHVSEMHNQFLCTIENHRLKTKNNIGFCINNWMFFELQEWMYVELKKQEIRDYHINISGYGD